VGLAGWWCGIAFERPDDFALLRVTDPRSGEGADYQAIQANQGKSRQIKANQGWAEVNYQIIR
jgi:hypothetical protein